MAKRWTQQDKGYLLESRYRFGRPWDFLAIELGRSMASVQTQYYRLLFDYEYRAFVLVKKLLIQKEDMAQSIRDLQRT